MALRQLAFVLFIGLLSACVAAPASDVEAPAPVEVRFPAIARGPVQPNDEVAAARLLADGRRALEAGDFGRTAAAARELTTEYQTVPGSSEGLWLLARSALVLGEHVESAEASDALIRILPGDHSVLGEAMTLRAEALFRSGDLTGATSAFLALPADLVTDSTVTRIEEAVAELDTQELTALLPDVETGELDRRAGPVLAELALVRVLEGRSDEAMRLARRADTLGVAGRADALVAAIFAGDVSDFVSPRPLIGAVLPVTGSPTNQEYTALFMEGVEVAMDFAARDSTPVEFAIQDNRGTGTGTERGIEALEAQGAVAVLGPLLDENVFSAQAVRTRRLALLSPTARSLPAGADAVYSMAAVDLGAAQTLAETVSDLGYDDAVVIHPTSPERTEEALAFEEAFLGRGGTVRARLEYDPGTTYFEDALVQVDSLNPQLLVMAVPPSDIQLLAPQVGFFGLDTLGIQVAGTAGWTSEAVISSIDQRHTNGVIAVSSSPPGRVSDLTDLFIEAYEDRFRKTLRSLVPAIGFDMFRLVLASYGGGVRTSGDFVRNLESVRQFEGVTGTYSVVDGQIVRDFFPVRIYGGQILPIDAPLPEPPGR